MKNLFSVLALSLAVTLGSCKETPPKKIVVNPTPHSIEQTTSEWISVKEGFKNVDSAPELTDALTFATGTFPVTVTFGEADSKAAGVEQVDGAYSLMSSKDGVRIIGYNERGAFYGIQTLKQLVVDNTIPVVTIKDYPDIPYRGVVEGFYGTPWSHEVRKSLIDYYGKYKMNSYLYGPKDDPYHSSLAFHGQEEKEADPNAPNWRDPYPEVEGARIKELVEVSNANRVDFIWAIHPGKDIQWTESDYQKLLAKFESMYAMGVRSFAVFFDDISGIGTKAEKQAELLNRLQAEFVEAKGDVKPLIMCPTDYTKLWADPSEDGYLSHLGDNLHPSIHVMWTGDYICCDITDGTLEFVNSLINRPTFIWWNYPVTDYVKHIMLQGPVYGNSQVADKNDMAGFVSNPMEHGEASKIALYGVADYTWNIEDYKPIENWERALVDLMPEAADAYRTFAINSTDTETGYRRDESWETTTFTFDNYTQGQFDSLYAEFEDVKNAPTEIFTKAKNQLLVNELTPWLVEFGKLGERGLATMDMIKLYEAGDNEKFWDLFRTTIMTPEQLKAYKDHRSGTLKLTPFINDARSDMATAFYGTLSGKPAFRVKTIASFANASSELGNLMLDGKSDTHYTSGAQQGKGSWIGVDLGTPTEVSSIYIEQGRNNVDDGDFFERARLEVSLDKENWTVLADELEKQYIIEWSGEPVKAQYVRLARLDSDRKSWATVRRFEVNPRVSAPKFFTNITQLKGRPVEQTATSVSVSPVLEVVSVKPSEYFGVELPLVSAIKNIQSDLGTQQLVVEYSQDGKNWTKEAASAKMVRVANMGTSPVNMKLSKLSFELVSSADAELAKAMDGDIVSFYTSKGSAVFAVNAGAGELTVLSNSSSESASKAIARDADGNELSSTELNASLETITLPQGTLTVEITGNVDIYELIFK